MGTQIGITLTTYSIPLTVPVVKETLGLSFLAHHVLHLIDIIT